MQTSLSYSSFSMILLCLVIGGHTAHGQLGLSLQVEVINSLDKLEYYVGQRVNYTVKSYPDEWRKGVITDILVDDQVIIFNNDMVALDQFSAVKRFNTPARMLGGMLFTFGAGWTLYGVVATLVSDFRFTGQELFIGLGSLGSGFLISKLFNYHKYDLEKGARLRIIDRRFSVPDTNPSPKA